MFSQAKILSSLLGLEHQQKYFLKAILNLFFTLFYSFGIEMTNMFICSCNSLHYTKTDSRQNGQRLYPFSYRNGTKTTYPLGSTHKGVPLPPPLPPVRGIFSVISALCFFQVGNLLVCLLQLERKYFKFHSLVKEVLKGCPY